MGWTFHMNAVTCDPSGRLTYLEGIHAKFSMRGTTLFELIDPVDTQLNRHTPLSKSFPWYGHLPAGPGEPSAEDCFPPRVVLESLQKMERELQRNAHKYPAYWLFWVSLPNGTRESHRSLDVWYRDRACRLFSDARGCWAVETAPGPREGIHHDLKDASDVVARLTADGPELSIGLERVSFLTQWSDTIANMKRVCITAMQANGMIFTTGG